MAIDSGGFTHASGVCKVAPNMQGFAKHPSGRSAHSSRASSGHLPLYSRWMEQGTDSAKTRRNCLSQAVSGVWYCVGDHMLCSGLR